MQFVEKNVSYRNVLLQWKDYISFCEELGYDLRAVPEKSMGST